MARNGTGTYARINTFVAGTTITASDHNENWADLETEMTNSVAADGQTTMTGPLKASNGTVAAPSHSFGSDTDTGMYRIGADNIGIGVGGTKIVDISSTGLSITGTLTPSGGVLFSDGTVGSPGITFSSDTDSGLYRIGANNIGAAVNSAKVLDISTTGLSVTGTLTSSGAMTVTAGGMTVTDGGLTVTAGGLTVTAGSVALPAGSVADAALAVHPAIILLASASVSSASTVSFVKGATPNDSGVTGTGTVVLDDTYDDYMIEFNFLPGTDDVGLYLTVGTGATPTYQSTSYSYSANLILANGTNGGLSSTGDGQIVMTQVGGTIAIDNASAGCRGWVKFSNPEAAIISLMNFQTAWAQDTTPSLRSAQGVGCWGSTTAITAIRFAPSSGAFASGRFSLYGIRKS